LSKIIISTLIASAGILGIYKIDHINKQERAREQAEFSLLFDVVDKANMRLEKGSSGQELLDNLNIKYNLRENEKVILSAGSNGAYVYVGSLSGADPGYLKGFVGKEEIEKYLSQQRK